MFIVYIIYQISENDNVYCEKYTKFYRFFMNSAEGREISCISYARYSILDSIIAEEKVQWIKRKEIWQNL